MTSIALHAAPERRDVWAAQLRATGLALRVEAIVYLALLALFLILAIIMVRRGGNVSGSTLEIGPGASVPMMLIALFLPLGVWRSEDPSRRAYHLAMPVDQTAHTWIRIGSGWLWLMSAVVAYLGFVAALGAVAVGLTDSVFRASPAWYWAVPFTVATVAYLLSSAVVVASEHPWRWMVGIVFGLLIGRALLDGFDLYSAERALDSVVAGRYGLGAALWGDVELAGRASASRWISATLLWGTLGLAGLAAAAHWRRREG